MVTKPNKRVTILALLGLFILAACGDPANVQASNKEEIVSNSIPNTVTTGQITAASLAEMLPKLESSDREHLESFAATVPEALPNKLAYPQFTFMQAALSKADGTPILRLLNGYVHLQGVIANPGTNYEQTNIICLRNSTQVSCSPEADVWAITLTPKTLAFVPYKIKAEPGDMLTFLYVANQEPLRLFPASIMQWLFVEYEPNPPSRFVQASAHEKIEVGCDFSTITQSGNLKYGMPGRQKRGTSLSLVFQTCEPVKEELVQLIPIVDRRRVVNLPGEGALPVIDSNSVTFCFISPDSPTLNIYLPFPFSWKRL